MLDEVFTTKCVNELPILGEFGVVYLVHGRLSYVWCGSYWSELGSVENPIKVAEVDENQTVKIKYNNCLNCGAILLWNGNSAKCEYCGTEYGV